MNSIYSIIFQALNRIENSDPRKKLGIFCPYAQKQIVYSLNSAGVKRWRHIKNSKIRFYEKIKYNLHFFASP